MYTILDSRHAPSVAHFCVDPHNQGVLNVRDGGRVLCCVESVKTRSFYVCSSSYISNIVKRTSSDISRKGYKGYPQAESNG